MNSVVTHVHVDNVTLRLSLHHTGFSDMVILLCNSILLLQEKWPFSNEIDMRICPENERGSEFLATVSLWRLTAGDRRLV